MIVEFLTFCRDLHAPASVALAQAFIANVAHVMQKPGLGALLAAGSVGGAMSPARRPPRTVGWLRRVTSGVKALRETRTPKHTTFNPGPLPELW